MVFHDKKGKTIHDIRPEEIHVYENGAEEKVNSFRYVEGSENAPAVVLFLRMAPPQAVRCRWIQCANSAS